MNEHADPGRRQRSIDIDIAYARNRFHTKGHMMRTGWDPAYFGGRVWRPSGAANPDVRVSDAERNEVADKLARHFADGRLDQAEFKERLDKAMSAKTQGDLAGLFDDLPRLDPEPSGPPPRRRRRRLIPFVLLLAFIAVAATMSFPFGHGLHISWLLFVLAGLFFWSRAGRRHFHYHHNHSIDRGDQ